MPGSEYYDDRQCAYCGTWYSPGESHTCQKIRENIAKAKAIEKQYNLEKAYNLITEDLKQKFGYMEDIQLGYKTSRGWVRLHG